MRTCTTPGCTASLDGRPVHTLYCIPCRKLRDKEASKIGGIADRERKRKGATKVCEMKGCRATIPQRDHFCAKCRPLAEAASRERKNAAKRAKPKVKRAPTPKPQLVTTHVDRHTRALAAMGLKVVPGATPASEVRRLSRGEIDAIAHTLIHPSQIRDNGPLPWAENFGG